MQLGFFSLNEVNYFRQVISVTDKPGLLISQNIYVSTFKQTGNESLLSTTISYSSLVVRHRSSKQTELVTKNLKSIQENIGKFDQNFESFPWSRAQVKICVIVRPCD